MDQLKKIVFLCSIPLLLYSCRSEKDKLSRIWFYTYNNESGGPKDTLLTPVSFLDLRQNGTYTMDFSGFDAGRWDIKDDRLVLTNDKNQVSKLGFRYISGKDLRLYIHDMALEFEGMQNQSLTEAKDPFSRENNHWRIQASAKETDKQITNRLVNHFQFWQTYFSWALDQEIKYVDVRSTPTPVKVYGNGFGLKPFEQLPAAWKGYFYDEEDCRKANDKIRTLFDNNSIAWPQTDNKYKMFLSAFQQMKQKI